LGCCCCHACRRSGIHLLLEVCLLALLQILLPQLFLGGCVVESASCREVLVRRCRRDARVTQGV
jgi:hypothetical protein